MSNLKMGQACEGGTIFHKTLERVQCETVVVMDGGTVLGPIYRRGRKNFFDQILFFAISKMAKNKILNWEKVFKLPEIQFNERKKNDLFDFMSFFAWTFLNILAHCDSVKNIVI